MGEGGNHLRNRTGFSRRFIQEEVILEEDLLGAERTKPTIKIEAVNKLKATEVRI